VVIDLNEVEDSLHLVQVRVLEEVLPDPTFENLMLQRKILKQRSVAQSINSHFLKRALSIQIHFVVKRI
jgi:hypothetical protein